MTRLDQHVRLVQTRQSVSLFLLSAAWTSMALAAAVLLVLLVDRLFGFALPRMRLWTEIAAGVAAAGALAWTILHRPGAAAAAALIDERLVLQERFSTAIYARGSSDPFAKSAVADAESAANRVSLAGRFPVRFPRPAIGTALFAAAALGVFAMSPLDLLGHREAVKTSDAIKEKKTDDVKRLLQQVASVVDSAPPSVIATPQIIKARAQINDLLAHPPQNPDQARRDALDALQQMQEAIKEEIKTNQAFADNQNDMRTLASLPKAEDPSTPIGAAQQDLQDGNFNDAVKDIQKAVQKFDNATPEDQAKQAQQMQNLANQIQNLANNPQVQQQAQNQLQQMGATAAQAQQISSLMQQAAQGQATPQQVAQAIQQVTSQMNNGQGPTAQQQAKINQLTAQLQGQANAQAQAQNLAGAAQQLAAGMKQQAQAGQQAQNGQNGQPGGSQPQPGGQQGNQPGSGQMAGGGQGSQQMQQGQAAMNQAMQAMAATASDAQSVSAAQQAANSAAQQAANGLNGGQGGGQGSQSGSGNQGSGSGNGNGQGQGSGNGQWAGGGQQGNPGGGGGFGGGGGQNPGLTVSPYTTKQEMDPSKATDNGKILASSLIKSEQIKGESKAQLNTIAKQAADQDTPEDVDTEGVSGQSQKVVRDYFGAIQKDSQ